MKRKKISLVANPSPLPTGWKCTECDKVLSTRQSLLRHVGWVHKAPYTAVDSKKQIGKPVYNPEDFEDSD